jgi:hypothetical protein
LKDGAASKDLNAVDSNGNLVSKLRPSFSKIRDSTIQDQSQGSIVSLTAM